MAPFQGDPFFAHTRTVAETQAQRDLRQRDMQFAELAQRGPLIVPRVHQQIDQIGRLKRDTMSLRDTNAALKASIAAATLENADLASSISNEALEKENAKLRKEVEDLEAGKIAKAIADKNRITAELAEQESLLRQAESSSAAAVDVAPVALPDVRDQMLPLVYGFPSYAYGPPPPPPSIYDIPIQSPSAPALELSRGVYSERIEKATSVKGSEYLTRLRNAERTEALMALRESDAELYDPFFRQTGSPVPLGMLSDGFFQATNKDDADRRDLMKVKYPEYFVPCAYGDKPNWWWSGIPAKHRGTLAKQHFSDPRHWGTQVDRELFLQAELDKQLGDAYGTDPALSEHLLVQAVATHRGLLGAGQEGHIGMPGAARWMLQNPGMMQQQIAK